MGYYLTGQDGAISRGCQASFSSRIRLCIRSSANNVRNLTSPSNRPALGRCLKVMIMNWDELEIIASETLIFTYVIKVQSITKMLSVSILQ